MSQKDPRIMKYVPRIKRSAIQSAWIEEPLCDDHECSYWIQLKEGYHFANYDTGARTVSQDTIPDLRYQIEGIEAYKDDTQTKGVQI